MSSCFTRCFLTFPSFLHLLALLYPLISAPLSLLCASVMVSVNCWFLYFYYHWIKLKTNVAWRLLTLSCLLYFNFSVYRVFSVFLSSWLSRLTYQYFLSNTVIIISSLYNFFCFHVFSFLRSSWYSCLIDQYFLSFSVNTAYWWCIFLCLPHYCIKQEINVTRMLHYTSSVAVYFLFSQLSVVYVYWCTCSLIC